MKKRTICAFIIITLVSGLVLFTLNTYYFSEPESSLTSGPVSPFFPYNKVTVEPGKSLTDLVSVRPSGYSGVIMEMHLQSIDKLKLLENTLMFQQNSWITGEGTSYWIQTVLEYGIAANERTTARCIMNFWERDDTKSLLIDSIKIGTFYLPDTPYNVTLLTYIGVDGYPHSVIKVNNGLLLNHTETVADPFSSSSTFSSMNHFLITSTYDSSICPDVSGYFTINKYSNGVWSTPPLSLLEKENSQSGEFSEVLTFTITGGRVDFLPASTVPTAYTGIAYG